MTESFLPSHVNVAAFRGGRSPRDGYDRGSGLKYGGLAAKIAAEPDYQAAVALVNGRSIVQPDRLMNLYLLVRCYLPKLAPGDIIEYGCFRGGSAMFMAKLAQKHLPRATIYALDTFSGLPAPNTSIDALPSGEFAADYEEVTSAAATASLANLKFIKGLFSDTALSVLRSSGRIAMAHIDCDLFEPAAFVYNATKRYMVPGGYIVFDDATDGSCLGATEAVEAFAIRKDGLHAEQIDPHFVFRYPPIRG